METKRQSILARAAMTLLFTVLTTVTTWAAEWPKYITDVILVGGESQSEANSLKNSHSDYTFINVNLNDGASGDYIYLGYKTSNTANTNGGYITALYLTTKSAGDCSQTLTFGGVEYTRTPCYGSSHFVNDVKGDLNSNAGGEDIHLYYTKNNFSDKRVISDITIISSKDEVVSTPSGFTKLGFNGGTSDCDLNDDAGGNYIYMYFKSDYKVNRPYPEPSMASNLVYTGSPLKLISSTYSNSNTGTLYYRVGTSGSYTSDVNNVTATNAGTYTVYYYSGSNSYGNSSESYAHSKTVTIGKAQNSGATVVCADALESDGPSPSVTGNLSGGAITYTYATSQSGSYSATAPSTEGTYWVKATIAGDNNYNEYTTAAVSFKLKHDWGVHNTGNTANDAYVISTTEDLNLLSSRVNAGNTYQNKFFKLGGNITYDGTENNFTPIGTESHPFDGTFDGNGKTISGLNINLPDNDNVGLFGFADNNATIKNLKLATSTISGKGCVGAILGCGSNNTPTNTNIENCDVASDVNVSGSSSAVGGITGMLTNVRGCVSAANVSGFSHIGGIVGNSTGITISQCLYTGTTISGDTNYKGAITGNYDTATTTLTANYYTADLACKAIENSNDIIGARKAIAINAADGVTVTPTGDATAYNVSGITAYESNNGMSYGGHLYAGATETVSLNITYNSPYEGFSLEGYHDGVGDTPAALTHVSDNTYTLLMPTTAPTVTPVGSDLWGEKSGRDGSTAEKAYLITTTAGLDLLAKKVNGTDGYTANSYENTYFELGNDIAYSYDGLAEGESNYTAIGSYARLFSGKFDGKGHTISGIRISDTSGADIAIFSQVDGTVKNLVVSDCSIEAYYNIGGIAASLFGTIENCHVLSNVTLSSHAYIGGITGCTYGGTIKGCTSAATITGKMVEDSKARYLGGIVGYATEFDGKPTLKDNLFTGTISGDLLDYFGAIVGWNNSNVATLTNNYYTVYGLGGVGSEGSATGSDQAGAKFAVSSDTKPEGFGDATKTYGEDTYTGIKAYGNNGLEYGGKYYYPLWGGSGTEAAPYIIRDTAGLDKLASDVNGGKRYESKYFELAADIAYDKTKENNFTPIGNDTYNFAGNFDGKGHTISGISVNANEMDYIGVFGINDGTVKNLTVSDCLFAGDGYVGAIAGLSWGTVENCHVAADVSVIGNFVVGGVVGENNGTTHSFVLGCTSAATLSAKEYARYFGGIAGRNTGTLTDNLFTGTIDKMPDGSWGIGAITGNNDTELGGTLTNNFHICSGMGGVGNENDATNTDQDGAQLAYEFPTANGAMGNTGSTYGTGDYTGITAYANGLAYNGKYYCPSLWGGSGTAADPYIIVNTQGMDLLATNVNGGNYYYGSYFVLGNDIAYVADALILDLDNDGENDSNYMPVGNGSSFMGNFNGQGHTISGIRVNTNNMGYIGVFGVNDGTVKNLTVSDCLFAGSMDVGAIAGLTRGTIENCHVAAGVSITGENGVGGVVSKNEGFVLGCTSAATLSANNEYAGYFGGIAGRNTGTLTDNLFTGTIDKMPVGSWRIGAIIGYHDTDYGGMLTNNFHTCSGMGGVGNLNDATNTDQDGAQFAVSRSTRPDASIIGEEKKTYGSTDYTGITAYENGLYYNGKYYYFSLWGGSGTASDPYVIYNTEGLDKLATNVNGGNYYDGSYFVLGNDIVYTPDVLTLDLDNDGENDSNYMPVGKNGFPFSGNFDGQGHTISGIRVNANEMYYIGVFGINNGTVKNLTVSGCLFAGDGSVGAIAGVNRGTVENCHVAADVSVIGNFVVGGVVGENNGTTHRGFVLGCTSAATLSAKEYARYFGGIAGNNTGTLTDNLFTGTIDKMPDGSWSIGAITGNNNTDYGGTLTNNFHTCSGMGGVGNGDDATNTDQDGAQLAISSTTPPASIDPNVSEPTAVYSYTIGSTQYIGITAYEHALYYNGKYYYWSEDIVVPGDANGDGMVTISDAVAIVNYILGNPSAGFNEAAADVNGDGKVTISDAVAVVNMLQHQ